MKKLYALLVILIILYIGINAGAGNLPFGDSTPATNDTSAGNNAVSNSTFPNMDNFTSNKVNDSAVSYNDSNYNMTIYVTTLDDGQKVEDIVSNLLSSGQYTSNQTIDQNGVTAYFLYKEGVESYSADIYFNKNNKNYVISGDDISYEDSDYFINHCKYLIDTSSSSGDSGGFSRW